MLCRAAAAALTHKTRVVLQCFSKIRIRGTGNPARHSEVQLLQPVQIVTGNLPEECLRLVGSITGFHVPAKLCSSFPGQLICLCTIGSMAAVIYVRTDLPVVHHALLARCGPAYNVANTSNAPLGHPQYAVQLQAFPELPNLSLTDACLGMTPAVRQALLGLKQTS